MSIRLLFNASAIVEILIGLALLLAPALVIGLLLGDGISSPGVAVARVAGVGLLSLGVAGWQSPGNDTRLAQRAGLCIYNIGAVVVLTTFGSLSETGGIILWPTVVLHGLIAAMMLPALASNQRNEREN